MGLYIKKVWLIFNPFRSEGMSGNVHYKKVWLIYNPCGSEGMSGT